MSNADQSPSPPMGFERLATLAVSSMAEVELCRVIDGELVGTMVAVKRLPMDLIEDPELRKMFRDEIWLAAAIDHPCVARVLSWGEDARGLYLVSEFVHGVSLSRLTRTVVSTGEHFTERLIVYLAAQVCAGLAAAHELRGAQGELLGLVHRDLTPGNILLGFDGSVKITDFGLAKAKMRVTHTAVGVTKGEPAYMSPEQVMGQPLDARSDLFALGVVMWELFAQELPWRVRSVRDALKKIVQQKAPSLAEPCPKIDAAIVEVVDRCLAKPPEERYPSVHVLRGELGRWLGLHGYNESQDHLARFVRRNSMRQMRWLERILRGDDSGSFDHDSAVRSEASGSSSGARRALGPPYATPATGSAAFPPGRVLGSDDGTAPKPPGPASGQRPASTSRSRRREPRYGEDIADPESAPTAIDRQVVIADHEPVATMADLPVNPALSQTGATIVSRPRDTRPPLGSTEHGPAGLAPPEAAASNHTRTSYEAGMRAASQRIIAGTERIAARAHNATEEALVAARTADVASRRARTEAERAQQAASAAKAVGDALRAFEAGDVRGAQTLLAHAETLFSAAEHQGET